MSASSSHIDTLPTELGEALRHFERAQAGKASLSDIILGGQDGLVNVLGVILGVAAASSDQRLVIAAGLAAAFAESISMGAVAYTSTLADRDHYLSQIEREKREIHDMPEVERAEIEVIFRRWGFEGDLLDQSVEQIMKDERAWVEVMMNNELKLTPIEASSTNGIVIALDNLRISLASIRPSIPGICMSTMARSKCSPARNHSSACCALWAPRAIMPHLVVWRVRIRQLVTLSSTINTRRSASCGCLPSSA